VLGLVEKPYDKITSRLARFLERLWPYELTWKYVKGVLHVLPDFLSRLPHGQPQEMAAVEAGFERALSEADRQTVLEALGSGRSSPRWGGCLRRMRL
jgi:hypothetical protein